jgi:hypothetical protein
MRPENKRLRKAIVAETLDRGKLGPRASTSKGALPSCKETTYAQAMQCRPDRDRPEY